MLPMNESLPSKPLHILLKENNQHALTVLDNDYAEGLFRALRWRYFTNDEDYHTVYHDSLLRIWELRDTFASSADVVKMLFTVAKGKAIDRLRHLNTQAGQLLTGVEPDELEGDNLVDSIPAHELPFLQARIHYLRAAVDQLADKQRVVIEALCFEGVSIRKLAERLGVEYSTVTNTRDQAYKKMRQYLLQHHITPDMIEQLVKFLTILWLLFSTFLKNN